jgi:hypothetical protein
MVFLAFQNALNQNQFSNVLASRYNNKFDTVTPAPGGYVKTGIFVRSTPFEDVGHGTKLYVCQSTTSNSCANIYEYNLTTPYDISTAGASAVVDLAFPSSSLRGNLLNGITFDYSGQVVFGVKSGVGGNNIIRIDLITPWTFAGITFNDAVAFGISTVLYGIDYAKVNRTNKEYIYCTSATAINQYEVVNSSTVTFMTSLSLSTIIGGAGIASGISIHPSGSHVYVSNNAVGDNYIYRIRLTRPYDITSGVIVAANRIRVNPIATITANQTNDFCIKRSTGKPIYILNANTSPAYANIYTYTSSTN